MLELQDRGCHNIGFVSPTHFRPANGQGDPDRRRKRVAAADRLQHECLRLCRSLRLLDGIVDVYLPDLKYADSDTGFNIQSARLRGSCPRGDQRNVPADGRLATLDADGLLRRGLLIRLLVLPNDNGRNRRKLALDPRRAFAQNSYLANGPILCDQQSRDRRNVTSSSPAASPKANGSRPSRCSTISAWKKVSCRNTNRRRTTTDQILRMRRSRLET